ncbi:MAG: DNA repair protein RadA [Alphaproteobacteria bacterium]
MAKKVTQFACNVCGATFPKWSGRCDNCGSWDSLIEETKPNVKISNSLQKAGSGLGTPLQLQTLSDTSEPPPRISTKINEFDRAIGGGIVPGSAILVGGDPGIGKSTLLLQAATKMGQEQNIIYFSGEEAIEQIRLRAKRLGLLSPHLKLASTGHMGDILATMELEQPTMVVIDSIQTVYMPDLDSAPGTVSQVRTAAHALVDAAKRLNIAVVIVGHVTKEGQIAGPRMLEHMVDAVIYFEGERNHQFRILRSVKNRFGATDEIGVFEMGELGLIEVENPSALFLSDSDIEASGTAIYAGLEGSRPLLVEVQTLLAPSNYGTPRRAVVGADSARLNMIMAVLESRCGLNLANMDVYVNITGGLKINEPGADLAIAAALVSAATDKPIGKDTVVFGEIGLSGEIRAVSQPEKRLNEAARLGFINAFMPVPRKTKNTKAAKSDIKVAKKFKTIFSFVQEFGYKEK